MSVDYIVSVKRKTDDKVIGKFLCNHLKTLVGSEFAEILPHTGYTGGGGRFNVTDIDRLRETISAKIEKEYQTIFEKKLLIALASSKDIKSELEQDILDIQTYISEELIYCLRAVHILHGQVQLITEDNIKIDSETDDGEGSMAYAYNGVDLPKKTAKTGDNEYEMPSYVFMNDVYCDVEIN